MLRKRLDLGQGGFSGLNLQPCRRMELHGSFRIPSGKAQPAHLDEKVYRRLCDAGDIAFPANVDAQKTRNGIFTPQ
jgi:hypothetical protein